MSTVTAVDFDQINLIFHYDMHNLSVEIARHGQRRTKHDHVTHVRVHINIWVDDFHQRACYV